MSIDLILSGALARSRDLNQIILWLRGDQNKVDAVSLTGYSSVGTYNTTIANRDNSIPATGGKALRVTNYNQGINLFQVSHAGSEFRPSAAGRPSAVFYDSAGNVALSVSDSGLVTGSADILTTTNTKTASNKTFTAPNLTSANVTDYILISAGSPVTPIAGKILLYEAGDRLHYVRSDTTDLTLASIAGVETLSGKVYSFPITSGYSSILQVVPGAVPGTPSAGYLALYAIQGETSFKYKDPSGSIHTILDNLTALSGVSITGPIITDFSDYKQYAVGPATPAATYSRIWADTSGNLRYTIPSGAITTVLTSTNTPSVSTLSMARAMALGGL